ncbi:MAG: carboxypeptidase regulatory-like domain-containing protein [Candidatus Velthaea sp.]
MLTFTRVLGLITALALIGGPLLTAPAFAQNAQAQTSATVNGVATDSSGAPIAGVTVTLRGAQTYTTTTQANGTYTIANVQPGLYTLAASKGGFAPAGEQDYPIAAGTTTTLNVRLQSATLTSIVREIGRVSTNVARSQFNPSPASVNVVSQQSFIDQGAIQVQRVLDQTPGIVIDHPGTSSTNAAPGAITFPSIRGGLGFETASLIDGHPLAVGNFGDYVTTFLNTFVLQDVELIKGPGAAAPEINYAIGGTVNFRTLDPLRRPGGSFSLGTDSFGGVKSNYMYSGTTTNGRFGWVLDYAIDGSPGPLKDAPGFVNLPTSFRINCPVGANVATCQQQNGFSSNPVSNAQTNGIQNNPNFGTSNLLASGISINQNYNSKTELAKFRYKFSNATVATVSYLGSQTYTDQNGNHVYGFNTQFTPSAGYTGNLAPGSAFTYQNVFFPNNEWEINNEPIFQAEVRSSIKNDTVLARYYTASINRLQYNSLAANNQTDYETLGLYGTLSLCPATSPILVSSGKCAATTAAGAPTVAPVSTAFNGQQVPVASPGSSAFFRSAEEDKLHGGSFEYDHYIGDTGNSLTLAIDRTGANTFAYDYSGSGNAPSVAAGSRQAFTTVLLRGIFNVTPKLQATLSNYIDNYYQRYTANSGVSFNEVSYGRYDGRLGLAYRQNIDTSYRFAVGSAIAPPFLNLLDRTQTSPTLTQGNAFATQTLASGNLKAETSFGWDIGADFRLGGDRLTRLTTDVYSTNLFNQFYSTSGGGQVGPACPSGNTLIDPATCRNNSTGATIAPTQVPIFTTSQGNIGNARYQGVELAVQRDPGVGFGYSVQGALIRAYAYNINACFYGTVVNGALNCSTFANNTAVGNGQNFFTSGTGGSPGSFTAVNNHSIPYSQGYGEIRWRTAKGGLISFGEQYYGPNNSLNLPAFVMSNMNFRFPIGDGSQNLQVSIDNLFNTYGNAYITQFGGVAVPLVNGKLGLTNANVIGPRNTRLLFTKRIGNR